MAQPRLQVSVTAPEEAKAGSEITIDSIVSLSGYSGSSAVDVRVAFAVGTSVITERTVSFTEQHLVSFTHVFSSSGSHEIRVIAQAQVNGEQLRSAGTHTLSITGSDGSKTDPDDSSTPDSQPNVSTTLLERGGWTVVEETSETVFEQQEGAVTVTGTAATTSYEDTTLREEIAEKTLGNVDTALSSFFASQVSFAPPLGTLPRDPDEIVDEIESVAKEEFQAQLENNGVQNLTPAETQTLSVNSGAVADVTNYEATYPVSEMSFAITEDEDLTIPGDTVTVNGLLATWHDSENAYIAGGAYPGENYAKTIERQLTDAIRVEVQIDLGLTPTQYRQSLIDLVQSVQ